MSRRVLDHRPVVLRDLPADDAELRHQWDAGTVDWRRALVKAVIDRVQIRPSAKSSPRFDPGRVHIVWCA